MTAPMDSTPQAQKPRRLFPFMVPLVLFAGVAVLIDQNGRIAYKHIGPITPEVLERKLRPLIAKLRAEAVSAGVSDPRAGGPP